MFLHIFIASLLSGFFELDETSAFQFMVSRSIISGTIIGLILGSLTGDMVEGLKYGFFIGFFFDLIWLFRLPIGASIPPDYLVASSVTITIMIIGKGRINPEYIYVYLFLSILAGFLSGYIGAWLDVIVRKLNISFFKISRLYWSKGEFVRFKAMMFVGLFLFFFKAFLITFIISTLMIFLMHPLDAVISLFPQFIIKAFHMVLYFLPVIGLVIAVEHLLKESNWLILILGIIAGTLLFGFFSLDLFIIAAIIIVISFLISIYLLKRENI